jgi:hypothetical protein
VVEEMEEIKEEMEDENEELTLFIEYKYCTICHIE